MAQLRDVQTSELLAEGTPEHVALIAAELGDDEVIFDDVGEGFDPAAVLAAREARIAGLDGALGDAEGDALEALQNAVAVEQEVAATAASAAPEAEEALQQARARLEG